MRTLIFSTKPEAKFIEAAFDAKIFDGYRQETLVDLINYLNHNDEATVIITGDAMAMGWSIYHPAQVLFSKDYPKSDRIRAQARGRVRHPISHLKESGSSSPIVCLEVGKTYKTGKGALIKIMHKLTEDEQLYRMGYRFVGGGCGAYYTETGKTYPDELEVDPNDLVEEINL